MTVVVGVVDVILLLYNVLISVNDEFIPSLRKTACIRLAEGKANSAYKSAMRLSIYNGFYSCEVLPSAPRNAFFTFGSCNVHEAPVCGPTHANNQGPATE